MGVLKVRLQGQKISNKGTSDLPKYRNVAQAAYVIAREEGPCALFKGMSLTALRQVINVSGTSDPPYANGKNPTPPAVNLTTYTKLQQALRDWQPKCQGQERNRPLRSCRRARRSHVECSRRHSECLHVSIIVLAAPLSPKSSKYKPSVS